MKRFFFWVILISFWTSVCSPLCASQQQIVLKDCSSREIRLKKLPERVLIVGKAGFMITNVAFFFKTAPEKLVTYSKSAQYQDGEDYYRMLDPFFNQREFHDLNTNIEELASMKPDVVLARDIEQKRLEKPLSLLGIPVVFFNLESPKVYFKDIQNLGIVFGETERAEQINDFYRSALKAVKDSVPDKTTVPEALVIFYSDRGGAVSFSVPPDHWIQTFLIEAAGGNAVWNNVLPAGKGWKTVSFEQIARWNPEYIFVTSYYSDIGKAIENLNSNPLWQGLDAVKKQKIFAFPKDYVSWDQPDSRWILGLVWTASVLNPDVPKLQKMVKELYFKFFSLYGVDPSESLSIKLQGISF
jgi:iron complex transport system substrate-binding protein